MVYGSAVQAQERYAVREGFKISAAKPVQIVVFRPDVNVGTLTTGGLNEPNADWTAASRDLIATQLKANDKIEGATVKFVEDLEGDDSSYLAEYRNLFRAVAQSIQIHKLFVGQRLPTKKKDFDWTLGEGTQRIATATGADYALFMYTFDSYGSAGRKTAQIFGALLGVVVIPGIHIGYAGLVDLKTGDVVWFNADPQMGGDVRTSEGATKRVGQLLNGLPGRVEPTTVPPATK
ncbi:MAG: hypothetical protein K2P68_12120 [Sphingomonas sp.]|nr:hypothetical protein [Sphingomonas sp.]